MATDGRMEGQPAESSATEFLREPLGVVGARRKGEKGGNSG